MKVSGLRLCLFFGAISAACGAQATPDYYGEALGTVQGLVSNPESLDIDGARVIANWGEVGAMFGPARTFADVEGSFPASFTLDFYEAPPESVLFTPADAIYQNETSTDPHGYTGSRAALAELRGEYYDPANESRIAIARVLAVRDGTSTEHTVGDVLGGDIAHAILYVESDIRAGSYGEALLQGRPRAGYHLLTVEQVDQDAAFAVMGCQAEAEDDAAWKACGLVSPLRAAEKNEKLNVKLVGEAELTLPPTAAQWTRRGAPLPDPNAQPSCDNPMAPFIKGCE